MYSVDPEIVYYSRFLPTYQAGGGSRRLLQLLDLLSPMNLRLVNTLDSTKTGNRERKTFFAKRQEEKRKLQFLSHWDTAHRSYVEKLWNMATVWAAMHSDPMTLPPVVMDDPIYFLPLFEQLKEERRPIIAVCHNLESLSTAQVANSHQLNLLCKEIEVLGQCDLVITISREETFLLQNLGINAVYLPYYPPAKARDRLSAIRNLRKGTEKQHFLLLGTANNLATRQGMLTFIKAWEDLGLGSNDKQLLVAGYGTDKLERYRTEGVRYLGQLTDDGLDSLLQTIKCCICYQEQAAGALTRISEMLFAGIPIVANSHAARTYYNQYGVIEFSALSNLREALDESVDLEGHVPVQSSPNLSALRDQIRSLAGIDG